MTARLFADRATIADRVDSVARAITASSATDVVLACRLPGAAIFVADLARTLHPAATVDFLAVAAYPGPERPPGTARIIKDLEAPIEGRDVILVEDVVDTGLSASYLVRTLSERSPARLRVCTLIDRPSKRLREVPVEWSSFTLDDEYLVGYGLSLRGSFAHLPCLVAVDDDDALAAGEPSILWEELRALGI